MHHLRLLGLSWVAVAALGQGHAGAQITPYGNLDVAVGSFKRFVTPQDPTQRVTRVESGLTSGSYIGFKGQESLGEDWVASFKLESSVSVDTGAVSPELWGRTCELGLAAGGGSVQAGKSLSLSFRTSLLQSPFTVFRPLGLTGATNFLPFQSNSVTYSSPALGGWQVVGQYGAGEGDGSHDIHALQLLFAPSELALAATLTQDANRGLFQIGGSYGDESLKGFGQFARARNPASEPDLPSGHWHLGVALRLSDRFRLQSAWTHTVWQAGHHRDAFALVVEEKWAPKFSIYAGTLWQNDQTGRLESHGSSAFAGGRLKF